MTKLLGPALHNAHILYFNFYDLLLLTTFFQSIAFFFVFAFAKSKSRHHIAFICFMLSIGLGQFNFYITYSIPVHTVLANVFSLDFFSLTTSIFYLQGPLLLVYVKLLTHGKLEPNWWLSVPPIVFIGVTLWDPVSRIGGIFEEVFWRDYVFSGTVGFSVSAIFGLFCVKHITKYAQELEHNFSTIDTSNFYWLKSVTVGFCVIWLLEILPPFLYHVTPWFLQQFTTHTKNIATLALVSYVIFSSLTHGREILVIPGKNLKQDGDKSETDIKNHIAQITSAMAENKYYRKSNLNIETFSELIGMPMRDVSHIINHHFGKNFYEFVNGYRIEEAKALLSDSAHQNTPIQEIYETSGFGSKSSFNMLFKKHVGVTPSKFRANQLLDKPNQEQATTREAKQVVKSH